MRILIWTGGGCSSAIDINGTPLDRSGWDATENEEIKSKTSGLYVPLWSLDHRSARVS